MTTTTTTIWRARCRDCGLEQRRKDAPRLRAGAHCDGFCHDCVHPIEWHRHEVSEERGWKVGECCNGGIAWVDGYGRAVLGEPGVIHPTRKDAEDDAASHDLSGDMVIQRTTRRTLRRAG